MAKYLGMIAALLISGSLVFVGVAISNSNTVPPSPTQPLVMDDFGNDPPSHPEPSPSPKPTLYRAKSYPTPTPVIVVTETPEPYWAGFNDKEAYCRAQAETTKNNPSANQIFLEEYNKLLASWDAVYLSPPTFAEFTKGLPEEVYNTVYRNYINSI